jgi:hypothetical protein
MIGVQIPTEAGNFSLHHRVQNGSGAPSSLLSNGYQGIYPWGQSGMGVKLTTHLNLVPRLRMHGVIPPVSQYVFVAWCSVKKSAGKTLHLPLKYLTLWDAHVLFAKFLGNCIPMEDLRFLGRWSFKSTSSGLWLSIFCTICLLCTLSR